MSGETNTSPEPALPWWRMYSIRLAAAVSALTGLITSQPELLAALIGVIPEEPLTRGIFSLLLGAATFLVPTVLRMLPQKV